MRPVSKDLCLPGTAAASPGAFTRAHSENEGPAALGTVQTKVPDNLCKYRQLVATSSDDERHPDELRVLQYRPRGGTEVGCRHSSPNTNSLCDLGEVRQWLIPLG